MIDWWIIERSLDNRLSQGEKERLKAWLEASEEHARFYERVRVARAKGLQEADYPAWRAGFSVGGCGEAWQRCWRWELGWLVGGG